VFKKSAPPLLGHKNGARGFSENLFGPIKILLIDLAVPTPTCLFKRCELNRFDDGMHEAGCSVAVNEYDRDLADSLVGIAIAMPNKSVVNILAFSHELPCGDLFDHIALLAVIQAKTIPKIKWLILFALLSWCVRGYAEN
jgi:hypothetical protein